ncbi:MAG: hypothetical protein KGS61_14755, partial [Verrucomicrobia bacterium]|nr:hypothetical protein [Verrucomicrobiota bacterium]
MRQIARWLSQSFQQRSLTRRRWRVLAALGCSWVAASSHAQTATNLSVGVSPPTGTVLASAMTNTVFVAVTNFSTFTNLTVVGSFGGVGNLPFLDNGLPPDASAGDGVFSGYIVTPPTTGQLNLTLNLLVTGSLPPADPTQTNLTTVSTNYAVTYLIVPPPGNDNFTNAYKIPAA